MKSQTEHENLQGKTCAACRIHKPIAEFHHFGKDQERIGKWCESCFQRFNGSRKRGR